MELLFLVGRILYGGFFIVMAMNHLMKTDALVGYAQSKGVTAPRLAVLGSGVLILIGGLGVLLGIFVDIALACILVFLFFVTLKMHRYWVESDPMIRMAEMTNFMKNTALFGAALIMYMVPTPWTYALF